MEFDTSILGRKTPRDGPALRKVSWPIRPADEIYNVKHSTSFASQLTESFVFSCSPQTVSGVDIGRIFYYFIPLFHSQ